MEEFAACTPGPLNPRGFNKHVVLPCGLATTHVQKAMADFLDFLGFLNQQLNTRWPTPSTWSALDSRTFSRGIAALARSKYSRCRSTPMLSTPIASKAATVEPDPMKGSAITPSPKGSAT